MARTRLELSEYILDKEEETLSSNIRGKLRTSNHGLRSLNLVETISIIHKVDAVNLYHQIREILMEIEHKLDADILTMDYLERTLVKN